MILNRLKEKSNQKSVNKWLAKRQNIINNDKIETVAVLLNEEEFDDFELFREHFRSFNFSKFKIIGFTTNTKLEANKLEAFFNPNDFNWQGKIKNEHLKLFTDTAFDVLICFYKKETSYLNVITAMSKANFKIGLSNHDERLYDLIIDVNTNQIQTFKEEFQKYLNILNKLR